MARQLRRTKTAYAELFDNKRALFPKCDVTLFPNGTREIWITAGNHGLRITAGEGPAGLGIQIRRFVGGAPLSVSGNLSPDSAPMGVQDCEEITVTQYNSDDHSQAFKRWYADSENNPYPGDFPS